MVYFPYSPIVAPIPARTDRVRSVRAGLSQTNKKHPDMNYTVYVLKDDAGKFYKGLTNNIERRLKEHKNGHTKTTSRMQNIEIVYREEYTDFKTARAREVYLKTAAGRRFLKSTLE